MKNNLIYDINDAPPIKQLIIYAIQQVTSVFVATVLIASLCNTPVSSCLVGAGLGTFLYQLITGFKSPMFISSCGATVGAVVGAAAIGGYTAIAIGGFIIWLIYGAFAAIIRWKGIATFNRLFPPVIVGATTMVIGINLADFIPTYVGNFGDIGMIMAIMTMLLIAIFSYFGKGFIKTIPFLLGIFIAYIVAIILTVTNIAPLIDFSIFSGIDLLAVPDFTWQYMEFNITTETMLNVVLLFAPVAIVALLEHYSDHKVLSNIIGTDLTVTPGLDRTLMGDGFASFIGTIVCGLPNTSYGESIATTGFSRVASVRVITVAAAIIAILGFITPVQAFVQSIPSCIFGGAAMILYGFIASSGLRTLIENKVDFSENKNLIIVSVILTVGTSGVALFSSAFSGVGLAMVLGVILNLILHKNSKIKNLN